MGIAHGAADQMVAPVPPRTEPGRAGRAAEVRDKASLCQSCHGVRPAIRQRTAGVFISSLWWLPQAYRRETTPRR
jgi:hypothetical protein